MAACCSTSISGVFLPISPPHSRTRLNIKGATFSITHSQSLSSNSNLNLTTQFLSPKLQIKVPRNQNSHVARVPIIFAVQSNFFRAIQTVLKVGKDGVEAGTNLVPVAVPRPIARVGVTVVAIALSLFVVRSFVSTVFFALLYDFPRESGTYFGSCCCCSTICVCASPPVALNNCLSFSICSNCLKGVMGFVYFIYLALNKDKGSKIDGNPSSSSSSTSTDEAIEEAKRIMDKYK